MIGASGFKEQRDKIINDADANADDKKVHKDDDGFVHTQVSGTVRTQVSGTRWACGWDRNDMPEVRGSCRIYISHVPAHHGLRHLAHPAAFLS